MTDATAGDGSLPHENRRSDEGGTPDEAGGGATPARAEGSQIVVVVDDVDELEDGEDEARNAITEPGKLMRIALMLREMQEEVRQAEPDEAGRQRLANVHEQALRQMNSVLSVDLREELSALALPFGEETPTQSEIRIAQAQLIGWLEGLFQGIQAAIFSQQIQARQQLEQLRPRGIGPGRGEEQTPPRRGTGQYL